MEPFLSNFFTSRPVTLTVKGSSFCSVKISKFFATTPLSFITPCIGFLKYWLLIAGLPYRADTELKISSIKDFFSEFEQVCWQIFLEERSSHRKRCSENMQQIFRRTPILKCYFNKVAKQPEITLWCRYSPVNSLHIFRKSFCKNTSGRMLLILVKKLLKENCTFLHH